MNLLIYKTNSDKFETAMQTKQEIFCSFVLIIT